MKIYKFDFHIFKTVLCSIIMLLFSPLQLMGAILWGDNFDSGKLNPKKWSVLLRTQADRLQMEDFPARGKVLHIIAKEVNAEIATKVSVGGDYEYSLTFSFYQPSSENGGYAGVVHHGGCTAIHSFWWFEWQPPEVHMWTYSKGTWALRWSSSGIETDKWYKVKINNKKGEVRVRIYLDDRLVASSGAIPHDCGMGLGGPILFGAHTGGGLRGILLDDVTLEYSPTSKLSLTKEYKRKASKYTINNSNLRVDVSTDKGWLLSVFKNGFDLFGDGIGRMVIQDVTKGKLYTDADFKIIKNSSTISQIKISLQQATADNRILLNTTYLLKDDSLLWTSKLASELPLPHSGTIVFSFPFPNWCEKVFLPTGGAPFSRGDLRGVYAYRAPAGGVCIPLVTFYSPSKDIGLTIFIDPGSPKPGLLFSFDVQGKPPTFDVQWHFIRLQKKKTLELGLHIVPHKGDWRCGLAWLTKRFSKLFEPQVEVAPGHQVIAGQLSEARVKELRNLGFTWEETHLIRIPFYGKFISEENTPEELAQSNDYVRMLHKNDFKLYLYWSFVETEPSFAESSFPESISRYPDGRPHFLGWSNYAWMVPFAGGKWHDYILDQLEKLLSAFPEIDGVFVDNTLHSAISYGQDDGITFVEDKPAYQYAFAQHKVLKEAKEKLLKVGKGMWANGACDIESAEYMDGIMVEGSRDFLECQQYLSLLKPMIFITYYFDKETPFDERMGRLKENMKSAFLCGVMLGFNEWELVPETIDLELLQSWLPMFEPLRGRRWLLEPHCLVLPDGVKGNIFITSKGGYYLVLVPEEEMKGKGFRVFVKFPGGKTPNSAQIYKPEQLEWKNIGFKKVGNRVEIFIDGLKEVGGILFRFGGSESSPL